MWRMGMGVWVLVIPQKHLKMHGKDMIQITPRPTKEKAEKEKAERGEYNKTPSSPKCSTNAQSPNPSPCPHRLASYLPSLTLIPHPHTILRKMLLTMMMSTSTPSTSSYEVKEEVVGEGGRGEGGIGKVGKGGGGDGSR